MNRHFLIGVLIILSAFNFADAYEGEPLYCPAYGDELVAVGVSLPANEIIAGARVPVTIKLENVSGLPLAHGSLLFRIVGEAYESKSLAGAEGNMHVREYIARDIALKPEESAIVSFDAEIPEGLPAGEYALDILFVPNEGYNVESPDLSIYEKSGANTAATHFVVRNEASNPIVYFDTKSIKTETSGSMTVISANLVNTSTSSVSVPVSWDEYAWNAVSDKSHKGTFVEKVDIPASSRKMISRSIDTSAQSSYSVIIEAKSNGIQSILSQKLDGSGPEALVISAGVAELPETGSLAAYGCVKKAFADDETERFARVSVGRDVGTYSVSGKALQFLLDITKPQPSYSLRVDVLSATGEIESTVTKEFPCELVGSCPSRSEEKDIELILGITMLAAGLGGLLALYQGRRRSNSINL